MHYPLQELPGADYIQRTRKNVEDSGATVVVTFGRAPGGTPRTIEYCQRLGRPHLVIDADATSFDLAALRALEFVRASGVQRLNVPGPRASREARGYDYSYELVARLLHQIVPEHATRAHG